MKENYNSPEIEIILFEREDVITTSGLIARSANETRFLSKGYMDTIDPDQWSQ